MQTIASELAAAPNPFALMMNPEAVFAAMEKSDRLARLHSRICRPLDKPLIGHAREELDAFDDALDEPALDAET